MKHTGWRKPTPKLSKAEQLATAGERLSIPKNQSLLALKRVAAALGLKASDMMLLDTFGAFTKPQDWEEGRRPIVWASNAYLMEQTGFSLSALKRHAKRLAESGLIAFKDSPNGKRWGKRDGQGYIVEAYGYDLAPLAARAEEFEHLFAKLQEERALCKSIKNKITITRRVIRAKIEQALDQAFQGPWRELSTAFDAALNMLPKRFEGSEKLLDILDWFNALRERVEAAFDAVFARAEPSQTKEAEESATKRILSHKMDPTGVINEPHILDTKQPYPVHSNINDKKEGGAISPQLQSLNEVESEKAKLNSIEWSNAKNQDLKSAVDIPTVMASCPSFAEMARNMTGYVQNWDDFHRVAGKIRPMCGISEDAWNAAQQKMGPFVASAAIALIFDKHTAGDVDSPGGYLRGMVGKALSGDLHLDRSFYGRLNEVRA